MTILVHAFLARPLVDVNLGGLFRSVLSGTLQLQEWWITRIKDRYILVDTPRVAADIRGDFHIENSLHTLL
jgi:hypothetical protein